MRTYPALNMMERQLPPLRHGRQPYWRAPQPPITDQVFTPSWNWTTTREFPEGTPMVTLDANGAYLGALGNVTIAHSQLERAGAWQTLPTPRKVPPGYYKISVPYWAFHATCVHPLGDSPELHDSKTVWIAAPTLQLLLELLDTGHLGDFAIVDSYTTDAATHFKKWADHLKSVRLDVMDQRDRAHTEGPHSGCECEPCQRYEAFKLGYSQALSMMLTGEKCQTARPDWTHTVIAEWAATQWRKAWRYTFTGYPLVRMGEVDTITIQYDDLSPVLTRPKPPFRYDQSGRAIGAFKIKTASHWTEEEPAPLSPALTQYADEDDIL